MDKYKEIKRLIDEDCLEQALAMFENIGQLNDEDYFLRGKIYWRMGRRREAINDYHAAIAINPASPAAKALEQANAVMAFFNPDLLNP